MTQDTRSPSVPFAFWGLLFSILIGLADAGFILYQEMAQTHDCSSTGMISCAALLDPTYSKWFGVPVAAYAFFFYLFSLWIATIALKNRAAGRSDEEPTKVLFGLSALSLIPTVGLAAVSAFVLRSFCPYCMGLYAVSIVWFACALSLRRRLSDPRLPNDRTLLWGAGFAAYMAVVPYVFHKAIPSYRLSINTQPIASESQRTLGDAASSHTVVKFSDFQCPMCKLAGENLKEFERQERGSVKIVYKFYPLDSECNPAVRRKMHPDSCRAARAAYCASVQGQFWPFSDLIFQNQQTLPEPMLEAFAGMLNLDMAAYRACVSSSQAREAVAANIEEGDRLGVEGTPTIFIDGKKFDGQVTVEALRSALQR